MKRNSAKTCLFNEKLQNVNKNNHDETVMKANAQYVTNDN